MTFLDLTVEPVVSRAEIRFRWLGPDVSTFAELRTQVVRSVRLDGVSLPPPEGGRLRLSRAGGGDHPALVVEAEAGYSSEGRGLTRSTDPVDGADYVIAVRVPDGWECVANGKLDRREDGLCTFAPVSGMRPYDLTFCAGPYSAPERTQAGRTDVTVRRRQSLLGQAPASSVPWPRSLVMTRCGEGWETTWAGSPSAARRWMT